MSTLTDATPAERHAIVAARFLELADGRRPLREIVDLLAQGTDADRATVEADVASFVARLARAGVLRSAETEASDAP